MSRPAPRPRSLTRPILTLGLLVGAALGGVFYAAERAPESSPVSRGARWVTDAGCFACHGQEESDPRRNFRRNGEGDATTWRRAGIDLIWGDGEVSAAEVADWVTHGVSERARERHRRLLVQMPAYGDHGHLTASQIDDVTAWVLAEGLRRADGLGNTLGEIPALSPAEITALPADKLLGYGDRVARKYGCYQCHGELGQGRVSNLASFKGYIPGFQGADFRKLTVHGAADEVRHWIEHGRGRAIESGLLGPLAKRFTDHQAIPMPAYAGVMTEGEMGLLVRYVQELNRRGPLDAAGVDAVIDVIVSNKE